MGLEIHTNEAKQTWQQWMCRWQWTATHRVVDWGMTGSESTELTFPLAVRGFHIYTLTRLCTTDWKATESEKRTQQQRGQICLTGKNKGAGDADSIHLYWCQNALICQMIRVSSNECWMTITMDCLDNYSKYVIQKAEPIRVLCCYMTDLLSWLSSSNQHTFSMVAPGYIMV